MMAFDPKLFQGPVYSQPQLPMAQGQQNGQQFQFPEPPKNLTGWQGFWDWFKNKILKPAGEFVAGSPGGYEQVSQYEPHQRNALNFVLSDAIANLQNPQQGFEPFENEAIRNFNDRTIPALIETFQGGRLSSPLFQKQLGYAGRGLESMLASQKAQYGLENKNQALSQLQLGLTPQTSTTYFGATPRALQAGANALGQGLMSLFGAKR